MKELPPENWKDDPVLRARYDEELERLDKLFAPRIKAIQDSERLTAEDLNLIINV